MKETIHSSENLVIKRMPDTRRLEVTIRFSTSYAKGMVDATCPRCGSFGRPSHWELEGPDGGGNMMWLKCDPDRDCAEENAGDASWTQRVDFSAGWVETE